MHVAVARVPVHVVVSTVASVVCVLPVFVRAVVHVVHVLCVDLVVVDRIVLIVVASWSSIIVCREPMEL